MKIVINNSNWKSFAGLIIYRLLLDWSYVHVISPNYSYTGFEDLRSIGTCIASWLIFFLFYLLARRLIMTDEEKMSSIIVTVLYILGFIPFTTTVYMGIAGVSFALANCFYWLVLLCAANYIFSLPLKRLPSVIVNNEPIGDKFIAAIAIVSFIIVLYVSGRYAHFRLNFELSNVYDIRLESRQYSMPVVVQYMLAWTKPVNYLMLAYCLIKKKHIATVAFFAIQMLNFGIDGSKGAFFYPFLILIIVKAGKKLTVKSMKNFFIFGIAGVTFLAIVVYKFFHTLFVASLFTRRVLFTPCILNIRYFDFFTTHEPDDFRGSFLRHFGAVSPYAADGGVAYTIGRVYYNSSIMNCNNGLLSDAISNLGIIGQFVMPILIIFILRLLDRSTYGLDIRLVLVFCIYTSMTLISTSLMTALLTHGLLVLILACSLMSPEVFSRTALERNAENP